MNLAIKDYGRIATANITLKPGINLVIGNNRSGKTTLLRALAAVSNPSGAATPVGVLKKDTLQLVTTDAESASIALDGFTVKFPANKATGKRAFLPPSRIALGLDEWTTMDKADRVVVMRQLAPGVEVTIKDLLVYLGIDSGERYDTIDSMSSVGAVHTLAAQKTTERIGAWKHITRSNFGTKILLDWRPEGWMPEDSALMDACQIQTMRDELVAELTAKQQAMAIHKKFDEMRGSGLGAPSVLDPKYDAQLALLAQQMEEELLASGLNMSGLADLIKTASQLNQAIGAAQDDLTRCQSALKQEKARKPPTIMSCPGNCGIHLSIVGTNIVDAALLTDMGPRQEEIDSIMAAGKEARNAFDAAKLAQEKFTPLDALEMQRTMAVTESSEKKKALQGQIRDITNQKNAAQNIVERANFNRQWLKDNTPTGDCPTEEDIDHLQESIAAMNDGLKKIKQLAEANAIRDDILFWSAVKDASGDQGIRKTAMEKGLASINAQISVVAEKMFFNSILEITIEGDLLSDGRPVALMSGAERKQANIIMQSLVASAEKSAIILIDEVGIIFDALSRQSLFKMLAERFADKIVVVAMAGKIETMPSSIIGMCANVFSVKVGVVSVHGPV